MENVSVEDILLVCIQAENGNNRFFIMLRDGYIYCANLYTKDKMDRLTDLYDNVRSDFSDVYCLGRVSSEEVKNIEDWMGKASYNNSNLAKWDSVKEGFQDTERYLNLCGDIFPKREGNIWGPNYGLEENDPPKTDGTQFLSDPSKRDGMRYYNDPSFVKIIEWFEDSSYLHLWERQISKTGTDKNPTLECEYIATYSRVSGESYPENRVFKISTEEELEYTKSSMGLFSDPLRDTGAVSAAYPLEKYDYILQVMIDKGTKGTVEKTVRVADSVRYDNKGLLYFHYKYDRFSECSVGVRVWWPPTQYVSIAVIPKDVLTDAAEYQPICSPQELELCTIEPIVVK
ncbi:MAG: hypothetical protein J6O73_05070 [Lachnospiraceae bacterium]|nr:hypothetical protein [Lachnospiraceae bacterium]